MPQPGMLIQLDGSHHAWLEDRGGKFVLLLARGRCHQRRGQRRVLHRREHRRLLHAVEGLIESRGIPLALNNDRHAVFKHNARQPETAAEAAQFTR